ncbi:synaptosomal-associated protein 29-like [Ptychodera flava]|uniref:synaptosomal-associated protein 29-like n=1 Tax=Ptychodera flava TaxID=63121 RepID=UPI00396A77CB
MASYSGNPFEDEDDDIVQQRNQVQETDRKMLQSLQRSSMLVDESEEMGVETGKELMKQRDTLNRTEKNLDQIKKDIHTTRRRLTSLKSFFGGFANIFKSRPREDEEKPEIQKKSSERLQKAVKESEARESAKNDGHPALRLRDPLFPGHVQENSSVLDDERADNSTLHSMESDTISQQIDNHIDGIQSGLTRLSFLAHGLGEELDQHNELVDRINVKAADVDTTIYKTNKDLNKLLYT